MPSTNHKKAASFWKGKSVFLTGHTGFKGSWLSIWLHVMGARVTGYALDPPAEPNLYRLAGIQNITDSIIGDIRDTISLQQALTSSAPEIVIHMAAQPLVRQSYRSPVDTYSTNVMGTVNLFEAVRQCHSVRAVVNVTTDKCYENQEFDHPLREDEPLGGFDPYSSSKACSEIVTAAWRSSFFNPDDYARHRVAIATARAGNVIGGGDWAKDRLVPDCIRALEADEPIRIRNPHAVRPWQHVLEPLSGYLVLAQRLYEDGFEFGGGWNFGPDVEDVKPVEWIAGRLCEKWGGDAKFEVDIGDHPHEANYLRLDILKAQARLGWYPRWSLERALDATLEWVREWQNGGDLVEQTLAQIEQYEMCGEQN
ncbi:MAG: CDP-glucose 4,6-dehydratase [Desulfuromonadaceae bacterium]|nr:CDP-glucose 4,6-dehydratase [Desulfuromonadaceae bacterium]